MRLIEREIRIYQYIPDYIQEYMCAPTIREVGKVVGLKSISSVVTDLMHLEAKGMIEVRQDSPRAIRLVGYSIVRNFMIEELNGLRVRNNRLII